MKITRDFIKYGVLGTLLLTTICSGVLVLQALISPSNIKAGIATFRFNFTGSTFTDHPIMDKRTAQPDIIQSIQGGVQSVATGVATAVPGAVSQVQSAANSLSPALPESIEALIPRNLSLGTKQFCIGLAHNVSCSQLPLNLSNLVPGEVEKYLQPDFGDIGSLNKAVMKMTPINIYYSLMLGLIIIVVMTIVSICSMAFPLACLSSILGLKMLKVGLLLLLGVICCILFVVPVVILLVLESKAKYLPSWIQVEHGEAGKLTLWGLIFVTIAAITSTLSPLVS